MTIIVGETERAALKAAMARAHPAFCQPSPFDYCKKGNYWLMEMRRPNL